MTETPAVPTADFPSCLNQYPDPYPLLARIRQAGPVCALRGSRTSSWIITRHSEVMSALGDPRLSSDPARDTRLSTPMLASHISRTVFAGSMFTSDPPQHTRLRRAVVPFLARRRISSLQPFIEHTADKLIGAIGGGTADAVDDFAAPLTVLTICRLLGVPPHEHHRILGWSHALMTEQTSPSARQRSLGAGHALTGFLAGFLAEQKTHPADGLIGSLVTAPPGTRLSDEEILTMAMLMLVAGHETSIGLISAAIRHLLCDPAAAQTLRQHPEALPGAITETLRYDGPVTMTVQRIATADIRFPHAAIHDGDHVFLCLASANHDERRFPHAEQMLLDRAPNPHLGFGHGIHRCPGAALGLLEARIALGLLIRETRTLSLTTPTSQLRWTHGKLRCLKHLPVQIEPAAPRARGLGHPTDR